MSPILAKRARRSCLIASLILAPLGGCATTSESQNAEQFRQTLIRLGDEADAACRAGQPEVAAAKILQKSQLWQLTWTGQNDVPFDRQLGSGYYYASLAVAFHETSPICDIMVPNLSKLAVSYIQNYIDHPSYPETKSTLLQQAAAYALIGDRIGAWAGLKPMTLAVFAERRIRLDARATD